MEIRELNHPSAREFAETAAVLIRSFRRVPLFAGYLFPGNDAAAETFLRGMLRYALRAGRVFVAEEAGRGVVACALWTTPNSPELTAGGILRLGLWPDCLKLALRSPRALRRVGELFAMLRAREPEFPCMALDFLASAEKGAGAAVLRRGLEVFADFPQYVESIVSGNDHAYYRQFGFAPIARADFHGTDYAFLLRPAR
jgi:hypothetical protein